MSEYDPKWAEVERRMMALEERFSDLNQRVVTHDAVCLERQKTTHNNLAALEGRMETAINMIDTLNNRFLGWHTGVTSALFLITIALVGYLWSHK